MAKHNDLVRADDTAQPDNSLRASNTDCGENLVVAGGLAKPEDKGQTETKKGGGAKKLDNSASKIQSSILTRSDQEVKAAVRDMAKAKDTQAEEFVGTKGIVLPGQPKEGEVPSSTLTRAVFTKVKTKRVSSQKFPCFIPKSRKKVNIKGNKLQCNIKIYV